MNIYYPLFSRPVSFSENEFPIIVIEDQKSYRELVNCILKQIGNDDGSFIVSSENVPLSLSDTAELIINPFDCNISEKKNITLLYRVLSENAMKGSDYELYNDMRCKLIGFLDSLIGTSDFPLTFSENIPVADILKLADVHFDFENENLYESLLNYLTVRRDIGGKSIFILCNMHQWFSETELLLLYKDIVYRKLAVIFLENRISRRISPQEIIRIIDSDLCEIT